MNDLIPTGPVDTPGVYQLPEEAYHADPAISRSFLWTLYSKTPAHAVGEERKKSDAFDLGSAVHMAVLEPNLFQHKVVEGPENRRGNRWKDLQEEAVENGQVLLIEADYEHCLRMRDAVHRNPTANKAIVGDDALFEMSAFWQDPETGLMCRVRPDLMRPKLKLMVDLKTTASASAHKFQKSIADYGYHVQEGMYRDGWEEATGNTIDGFVFICLEKEPPYACALYELEAADVEEGRAIYTKALINYAGCLDKGEFHGYPQTVQKINLPHWAYKETI